MCLHYMFISLFAMSQRYGSLYGSPCYHSNKNGCFICLEHGCFFLLRGKKSVVSVVFVPSRDFPVLMHVLKTSHTLAMSAEARSIGLNMADLTCAREKMSKTKQL